MSIASLQVQHASLIIAIQVTEAMEAMEATGVTEAMDSGRKSQMKNYIIAGSVAVLLITVGVLAWLLIDGRQATPEEITDDEEEIPEWVDVPLDRIVDPPWSVETMVAKCQDEYYSGIERALINDSPESCGNVTEENCRDEYYLYSSMKTGQDKCAKIEREKIRLICAAGLSGLESCASLEGSLAQACGVIFGQQVDCSTMGNEEFFCRNMAVTLRALKEKNSALCSGITDSHQQRTCRIALGSGPGTKEIKMACEEKYRQRSEE
jgi:hypothetical protein